MTSLLTKLDPRNINWHKSPHKVTPKIIAENNAIIKKLENEQKLLSSRLERGIYKNTADFRRAWEAQNRSFERIVNHRDMWEDTESTHPVVNKQREIEKDRFMGNAISIQKKYDNVISKQAQKQGVCEYLSEKTCSKGKDCYWFGKEDVDGKDVGCYSRKEPRKNWSIPLPIKRSTATTLDIVAENPADEAAEEAFEGEESKMLGQGGRRKGGRKRRTKKRKRRKRKKTRRKRKRRRTKRRTKRRKR